MTGLVVALSFTAVLALVLILGNLVLKGASSIDWAFFTRSPVPAGQTGGGVANAIVGTGIVVGLAALIGVPIGIGAGMYLAEYGSGRLGFIVRFIADVLNGTPSIVIGIVAWTFIVRPTHRFSALAGSVALAILMIPMLARTTEEMVRLVPHSLREAALALGYPRWRTSLKVVARTALTGIVTGCLVGIARVAGETAPLLFTALGNLNFSLSVTQPMQTLSLQIYVYATGPFDEWHRLAWASALVLMGLVLIISMTLFLRYTWTGLSLRAASQNQTVARLMGVSITRSSAIAWGLGGLVGGIAGILVAPSLFLDTNLMSALLIKAFAGGVLGGLNSLIGVFLGCLALGVAENLTGAYVSPSFAEAITFIIIIAVLIVKPEGVFGRVRVRKA